MKILVTGATGYIGGRLVPRLLDSGHEVRCVVRNPQKLSLYPWRDRVEVVAGDALDERSMKDAMIGCDAAVYLVHSMAACSDFAARSARRRQLPHRGRRHRIGPHRHLGALGGEGGRFRHLASRQVVDRADGTTPVTEVQAAVIIGSDRSRSRCCARSPKCFR
jgi:uncharacterized protein YbjT (DUF2867 family)